MFKKILFATQRQVFLTVKKVSLWVYRDATRDNFIQIRKPLGWLLIATPLLWVGVMVVDFSLQVTGVYAKNNEILRPIVKDYSPEEMRIEELEKETRRLNKELQDFRNEQSLLERNDKETLKKYITKKFGEQAKVALAIATCESNISADRVGDGNLTFMKDGVEYGKSYGVFQIRHLKGRPAPEQLKQAKFNIDYAYNLYKAQGNFNAWSCYSKNLYQKHLASL